MAADVFRSQSSHDEPAESVAVPAVAAWGESASDASTRRFRLAVVGVAASAILALAVGFVGWSALSGGFNSESAKTVSLAANVENGIVVATVRNGDRIAIKASGTWCYGVAMETGKPICGGPEGIARPSTAEPVMVQAAKFGTLVGKIGDGEWFPIGTAREWVADRSGELRLAFNERTDGPEWWTDNQGTISVEVSVN